MRLFEAILDANHRALAGDAKAGLHPSEFAAELPVVALTCIDPRLNQLIPESLGIREEQFIWLRNAGNIITGPVSSTMRSLALACAVKGGKEIAIIGHTDCQVCKTTMLQLLERFRGLEVERAKLPENLNEFFGLFASERQNVIRATEFVRQSPLIGPRVPVHGLLMEITTGKLEWLVNGYQKLEQVAPQLVTTAETSDLGANKLEKLPQLSREEIKFPEFKIGESSIGAAPVQLSPVVEDSQPLPSAEPIEKAKPSATPAPPVIRLDPAGKFRIVGSDRKIYGPVTGEKVLQWIADDRIDWQTLAKLEGSAEWKPLSAWAASMQTSNASVGASVKPSLRSLFQLKGK